MLGVLVDIRIRYQLRTEDIPRERHLSPEDYFDPLEPGEAYTVGSVPKFDDAFHYLPHPPEDIRWTVLDLTDGPAFWRVRTQLLDGRRSLMTHSESSDGSEEMIHSTEVLPDHWHIVRTLKRPGKTWATVMNTLTVERPRVRTGRTESFVGSWSWDEMNGFGDVR